MPRSIRPPAYRLHKARGTAVVTIDGKDFYLGKYGSPESHERYARLIAGRPTNGSNPPAAGVTDDPLPVNGVILRYLEFASGYYLKHGRPTGEIDNIRRALASVKKLFGRTPASEFCPKSLGLVRQAMIDDDLARKTINGRISRIKRMFRWASKEGLVPATAYHGLMAVEGLKRGRSLARETAPITTVPNDHVRKTLAHVNDHVAAMIQVQELAGMRPQDVRNLRTCDLDMSGDVWIYSPWTHKTEHHGHVRRIAIGPRAQLILQPFLKPPDAIAYVFSPKEAVATLRQKRAALRKSKRTPSQLKRLKKENPKRVPAEQYSRLSYERAIARGCLKANVPHWRPNQLRHNCGTRVRRLYGLDGAAAVLGHRLGTVTEVYAEADLQKAIDIMRAIG